MKMVMVDSAWGCSSSAKNYYTWGNCCC